MSEPQILQKCREHFNDIVAIRRDIHMYPETGFEVQRTAGIVAGELRRIGIEVREGVGKTGVVGDLRVAGAEKTIALRADMDALPMDELSDVEYKSRIPGKAHMCGHDAHTAMLLGAARVIHHFRDRLQANVRFLFQPNEEQFPGGAPAMIADGALDGVDEIFGMHVWPSIDVKSFGICPGPALGQPDEFDILIRGVGTHAAMPYEGKDPIVIGAQLVTALQTIISRDIKAVDTGVVSVTQFIAGSAYNVIPQDAILRGTIRTYKNDVSDTIRRRMTEIVQGFAMSFGIECEVSFHDGYPVTVNDPASSEKARQAVLRIVAKKQLTMPAEPVLGGEDFSYYLQKIPGCFVFLGCRNKAKGIVHTCHHPQFDIDEECLSYGMALHSELALRHGCDDE